MLPSWVSRSSDCSFNLQLLFTHLTSLIQEQTVAMLQGHQYGQSLATKGHFFAEAE